MYTKNDNILPNVRIVLVNPSHAGNIGATARAMKNMGLHKLYLVEPKTFPHIDATVRSAGAEDVLEQAKIVTSLSDAIADCHFVIGTSARLRDLPLTLVLPEEASKKVIFYAKNPLNEIAIVFGRESSGLTNDELMQCNCHLHIPTNPSFSSLNLASAVQLITYEVRLQWLEMLHAQQQQINCNENLSLNQSFGKSINETFDKFLDKSLDNQDHEFDRLATVNEINLFYQHLEKVLIDLKYLNPNNPRKLIARLRRLFNRIGLERLEVNILRGILEAVEKNI